MKESKMEQLQSNYETFHSKLCPVVESLAADRLAFWVSPKLTNVKLIPQIIDPHDPDFLSEDPKQIARLISATFFVTQRVLSKMASYVQSDSREWLKCHENDLSVWITCTRIVIISMGLNGELNNPPEISPAGLGGINPGVVQKVDRRKIAAELKDMMDDLK